MNILPIRYILRFGVVAALCLVFVPATLMTGTSAARALEAASVCTAAPAAMASSGPGEKVFSSVLYLWKIAPEKFRPLLSEEDWARQIKRYEMTRKGIEEVELQYDIAEFEEEDARLAKSIDGPPDYVISAKKEFASDAACLAYYQALLDGFGARLAKEKVKVSKRRDHVFFKDKGAKYERKLYVKHYVKQKGKKKPRIIVSVRATMLE